MPHRTHELDVTLDGSLPKIMRRIETPSSMVLAQLHEVLQVAMGWRNAHRFAFYDEHTGKLSTSVPLSVAAPFRDSVITYIYDFDDHWTHRIRTRTTFDRRTPMLHPRCTAAARACPPEGIGGMARYQSLVAMYASDRREEGSLPPGFEPRQFDKAGVNHQLAEQFCLTTEEDEQ